MSSKNLFWQFVLVIFILFPNTGRSQFCDSIVVPPTTINSIFVTDTSTGSVSISPFPGSSCNNVYTSPINSTLLGLTGAFTYTMNFSFPVNNLDFLIVAGGGGGGNCCIEDFTFTTNAGIPSIVDQGSCRTTISNNVIRQGLPGQLVGGGNFTLVNPVPYTSLTVSGSGPGAGGSFFAICSSSVVSQVDTTMDICKGDSVFIGGKYQKEPGFYADTIFGGAANGDDSIVVTNLIVNSIAVDLGKDTTLCQGDALTLDATTSNASYLWQDSTTAPTFNVTKDGIYWVQITVDDCIASDTIFINTNSIDVDLGRDTTLNQGDALTLDATTSNASYLWQDSTRAPTFNVTKDGIYWVQITVGDCSASDTILINKAEDRETFLEMPNVFTPNNDGINDQFAPMNSKGIISMHLVIYTRWGNKLFETNSTVEWEGQDATDGIYFWTIDYTDINGAENKLSGYVTVLR